MCLDLSESVCTIVLKFGCYPHQLAEDSIISEIVKPGMVVFDIGANIGWYSCLMHRLNGGSAPVIAVEPMPRALNLLRKTAALRSSITVIPAAIGEGAGHARLCQAKALDLSQVEYSQDGEAEVVTIDNLATQFDHPAFIKIDVEGAELLALRGAARTLSHPNPPFILFEYIQTNTMAFGGYKLAELTDILQASGYVIYRISHDAELCATDTGSPNRRLTNDYLAVPYACVLDARLHSRIRMS